MKKLTKVLLLALLALCLLSACKKKEAPLESYTLGEDEVVSLDSILTEGEAILASIDAPTDRAVAEKLDTAHTYHYRQMEDPAALAERYIQTLRSSEQGFVPIDTENRRTREEPVTDILVGSVILGKAAAAASEEEGDRFLRVVVGWSEYAVAVQVAYMGGKILSAPEPEKSAEEEAPQPTAVTKQMEYFNTIDPGRLGLEGDDMRDYMVFPQQGWVLIDGASCRVLNVYLQDVRTATNVYMGTFYLGSDLSVLYKEADGQFVPVELD